MAITDKTRKLLWGKSGNRCAYCYAPLTLDGTSLDDISIVGEECHIVSGQSDGPRHTPTLSPEEIDGYSNLLLLCRVHHKLVDDQWRSYDVARLRSLKSNHEQKVAQTLGVVGVDGMSIENARDLLGAYNHSFRAFHSDGLPGLVPLSVLLDKTESTNDGLIERGLESIEHVVLMGASGCGKTHTLQHAAIRASNRGIIPIFVRAALFNGDVDKFLDRAVALHHSASYAAIRRAASIATQHVRIFVDALNECPQDQRSCLRESLLLLGRKGNVSIWVSSTEDPRISGSLSAVQAEFLPLSGRDRALVFGLYAPNVELLPESLAAFTTPLHLHLAAEVSYSPRAQATAYELVRGFVGCGSFAARGGVVPGSCASTAG